MDEFFAKVETFSNFIWGGNWGDAQILPLGIVTVVLLGAGLFFTVGLKFRPFRRLGPAFASVWRGRTAQGEGEITPWQAISTALSGQVGTGNLAGVATAITLGGPGAIFWMWMTAIIGMASSFAESSLAVRFRERHPTSGRFHGGPMYYIRNGLGRKWGWLALLFCIGTVISSLLTGNMIQSNSITQSVMAAGSSLDLNLPAWSVGVAISVLTFMVIIGGIHSIGAFAGRLVPFMAVGYVLAGIAVLALHYEHIDDAFALIFRSAFGLEPVAGGLAGYGVLAAIRAGVARGLFSNEAGQGSTPIAHAAAQTNDPVKQGEIASVGVFIDTIIICTMTALVILVVEGSYVSGGGASTVPYAWQSTDLAASAITTAAFSQGIFGGQWVVLCAQFLFAFTTIIGWAYYGEQTAVYIFGERAALPFRYFWVVFTFVGASVANVNGLWLLGDIGNAVMLFPNVIAILALSGVVFAMAREADRRGAPASGRKVSDAAGVSEP